MYLYTYIYTYIYIYINIYIYVYIHTNIGPPGPQTKGLIHLCTILDGERAGKRATEQEGCASKNH